jgi:hypothetical protein
MSVSEKVDRLNPQSIAAIPEHPIWFKKRSGAYPAVPFSTFQTTI